MSNLQQIELVEGSSGAGPEWTLLAVGDFCARGRFPDESKIRNAASELITEELQTLIADADISIVNMEGPIATSFDPIPKSGPSIQLDPVAPLALRQMGFEVVSLANNHVMDYGPQALKRTIQACETAGLLVCGAGSDEREAMKPLKQIMAGSISVSIFAFCEREFGVAERREAGSAWISHPMALKLIAEAAKKTDVVVVLAHGGVEDVPFPPIQRQAQLRQFIDAGATLVIGHHPHVPQGWERYEKGIIFYSLGNFLFDHPDGTSHTKREWGLLILARFRGEVLSSIELVPVEMLSDRRIGRLGENRDLDKCLRYMHSLCDVLADPHVLVAYWQETAVHLWSARYRPWLQYACANSGSARSDSIRGQLSALYRVVRGIIARRYQRKGSAPLRDIKDGLLLLNSVRNESHRWAIETALAVIHGDKVDRRTPEVQTEVRELLTWVEE